MGCPVSSKKHPLLWNNDDDCITDGDSWRPHDNKSEVGIAETESDEDASQLQPREKEIEFLWEVLNKNKDEMKEGNKRLSREIKLRIRDGDKMGDEVYALRKEIENLQESTSSTMRKIHEENKGLKRENAILPEEINHMKNFVPRLSYDVREHRASRKRPRTTQ